jgi:hypothetical protein
MIGIYNRAVVLLLAIVLLFNHVESKRIAGTASLVSNKVIQIGKFSFRPVGWSVVNGTFTYKGEPRGAVYLFMDTEWGKFRNSTDSFQETEKQIERKLVNFLNRST